MWFNLKILKEVISFYRKIIYWRSFLLIPKISHNWNLYTIFLNKNFKHKFKFARKLKKSLYDFNNYFLIKNKQIKFINSVYNNYNLSFFYLYILFINNINFIVWFKFENILSKQILLKKKYISLLNTKRFLFLSTNNILNNIFILYKNFYLSEKILLYIDLYIFQYESFFYNFTKLTYFLKYFFLRKCPLKLKLKIWDDSKFTVHTQFVFFKKKSIWLKNLEIFEEENIDFFNEIPIDNVFWVWDVFKSKLHNKIDNNFKYLYYKYKYLNGNFEYLIYKLDYLKKKKYFINLYLLMQNYNINFFKKKLILKNLIKIVPFLKNRENLLNLIYIRRKNLKLLKKIKFNKFSKHINVLNKEKKKFFIYFFLLYI